MGLIVRNINFTGNFRGTFPQVPPPPPAPSDVYGAYTVLDLPGTGTNNTNNSVFVDSSSNNFAVTRVGNTTQGSFSPFSTAPGYWSNYFDGNGDFLSVTDSSAFALSGTDFTIEAWVYLTAYSPSPYNVTICGTNQNDGSNGYYFAIGGTSNSYNSLNFLSKLGTTISTSFGGTATLNLNTWYHVALSKSGTTYRMFVNGQVITTTTSSGTWTDVATLKIGAINVPNFWYYFPGYISNLRIVKGTAVYTSNFTPSTTPLTAVSGTSLLTCQSNRFIDNSGNNFTITRNGDVSVSAFGPYAPASSYNSATMGGSIYFDGSGDYLTLNGQSAFAFGTDDFTVETWYYAAGTAQAVLFDCRASGGGNSPNFALYNNPTNNTIRVYVSGTDVLIGSTSIATNRWYHVAVSRQGTTMRLFINGVLDATATNSTNLANGASRPIIGADGSLTSSGNLNGYLSNLRVVKGTAVYTANFTPPTAPVTAISGTSLLLNGTNGAIVDASTKNNLETVGDAKVSTTVSANGSMYFDGNGDYLLAPSNDTQQLGAGNFTIEMWIKSSTGGALFTKDNNEFVNWGNLYLSAGSTGISTVIFFCNPNPNSASGRVNLISTSSVITNNWVHIAVSRTGNNWYLFVNGILEATASSSVGFWNTSSPFYVGCTLLRSSPAGFYQGYINNLRVTKGIGRYTANFTPPARS